MDLPNIGSKWDEILEQSNTIKDRLSADKNITLESKLDNEFAIVKLVSREPEIQKIIDGYLSKLKPFMEKSNVKSRVIREEGNQLYKENTELFKCIMVYTGT